MNDKNETPQQPVAQSMSLANFKVKITEPRRVHSTLLEPMHIYAVDVETRPFIVMGNGGQFFLDDGSRRSRGTGSFVELLITGWAPGVGLILEPVS